MNPHPKTTQELQRFVDVGRGMLWGLKRDDFNGKHVHVLAHDQDGPVDQCRLHCQPLDDGTLNTTNTNTTTSNTTGKPIRIKPANLIPYWNWKAAIPSADQRWLLQEACQHIQQEFPLLGSSQKSQSKSNLSQAAARPDIYGRIKVIAGWLLGVTGGSGSGSSSSGSSSSSATASDFPPVKCLDVDSMVQVSDGGQHTAATRQLLESAFPCYGDGWVHFKRFAQGVPNTAAGDADAGQFPSVEDQVAKRMVEWFKSGMCERCQFVIFEAPAIYETVVR